MAILSSSATVHPIYGTKTHFCNVISSQSLTLSMRILPLRTSFTLRSDERKKTKKGFNGMRILRSVEEETAVVDQETEQGQKTIASDEQQQSVSVPVSPSDKLTMFFQADGTMSEAAIPTVTEALQKTEGIADLQVQVLEGIASVELKKQTTVQATGVAANLVEIIQGSGFKLQQLNLSFEDEEDVVV